GQHRNIVPGIIDYFATAKAACMLANDYAILADNDTIGIGMDLNRTADRARQDGVFVVVEAHGAGLRHRSGDAVEAIEASGIGDKAGSLLLKHLPNRALALLGMP